ncbi:efflux RND transporter periplasmic adaptor subunit [Paraburkholderia sacchari]|uniref:Efflux RND transporter periplasmic adaptor subunit n=2 Tax=Paraburkholderia sacchari TaxID=159450 RepID=A0A8T6ZEF7_9BURK|nr:efflux RND transporter periplasmic adaptor subunit [Paraburkholderia sacchari]NLP62913.1 efflux RND transporter periplasmic adaptor subunit [Paraburkholderia sacchari]
MPTPSEDRVAAQEPAERAEAAQPRSPSSASPSASGARRRHALVLGLGCLAVALLAAGIVPRLDARKAQAAQVVVQRDLVVATVMPKPAPATQDLLLPGSVMPWADASIYARTSGYVQQWYADIGAHVKAGQTLARIDTPELDAQLKQARADEASAQANYRFASSTAQRWQTMLQTQSVAQQDADAKTSDAAAKLAALQGAQANVARLDELVAYQSVTAPFDGVITVRNVQVGALVTAGGTPGLAAMPGELFHIEQTNRLRVYVDVPQDDASSVTPGTSVWLATQQYPGRRFPATVARSANAIDPVSRTLHVEVDVDNADGALIPGAYAQVHLALSTATPSLEVPVSALLFRPDGVTIAVVDAHDKVRLRQVSIGRDFGTYIEIATGLAPTDRVINNPGDAIANGQSVRVATAAHGGKA